MSLNNDPKQLEQLINELIDDIGMSDYVVLTKIKENWNRIIGENIQAKVKLLSYSKGEIKIKVIDSVWRKEIYFRKNNILKKVNELLKKDIVKDLIIH